MVQDALNRKRFIKIIKYLLMLALAVALLYISFKGVQWKDFVEGLAGCNYWWIALSMLVGASELIIRSLRWHLLLRPLDNEISRMRTCHGVNMAFLTNFIFPRMGELVRCGVVANRRLSFQAAVGTVVAERALDMICLIIVVLLMFVFNWSTFGVFIQDKLLTPFAQRFTGEALWAMAVALVLLIAGFVACLALCRKYRNKRFFGTLYSIISGLGSGLGSILRMKHKFLFIVYTIALWASFWLTSYTTILAFQSTGTLDAVNAAGEHIALGGGDALFLMVAGALGWVVPVQGGIGAFHFIVSLALTTMYGISQSQGVVFATISHESQAIVMIAMGIFSAICLWFVKRNNKIRS